MLITHTTLTLSEAKMNSTLEVNSFEASTSSGATIMPCQTHITCLINFFNPHKHNLSFVTDKLILTYRKICSSLSCDTQQCSCTSTREKATQQVMWWTGNNYAHPLAHLVTCLAMVYFLMWYYVTIIITQVIFSKTL